MKRISLLIAALLLAASASAQLCPPNTVAVNNDSAVGTTIFKLAKINASGNAVVMATTDTTGYAGLVVANAGTAGTACLAVSGVWPMVVDATTTAQHYLQISGSGGGQGHDTGAATFPTSGGDVVGRVQSASTGSGSISYVFVLPPEIVPAAGSLSGPGTTFVNDCAFWNNTIGTLLGDGGASGCTLVNNVLHAANSFYSTSYSTGSISGTAVSGLTSPTIPVNANVHFDCEGLYSSSSISAGIALAMNTSQTPQSIWYETSIVNNTSTGAIKTLNSITNNTLLSGTAVNAAATNYWFRVSGTLQWNASTPGTLSVQAATTNVAGTITVLTNSACAILP